jgi:hypothetical protein
MTPSIKTAPKMPTLLGDSGLRGVAILGMLEDDAYDPVLVVFFDDDCFFILIDKHLNVGLFPLLV